MSDARTRLLEALVAEVATNGLADRSLRDLADAVGSSHRMLNYHFGSRAGVVAAVVETVEEAERELLVGLSADLDDPSALMLALWGHVSSPEMMPFVRLFFECVAITGGEGLTDPWLTVSERLAERIGPTVDETMFRLGIAVMRGLLIDVLATGGTDAATEAMERFAAHWQSMR